jgi:hypothetical protein
VRGYGPRCNPMWQPGLARSALRSVATTAKRTVHG